MKARWPDFSLAVYPEDRFVIWDGPLRGVQLFYEVAVFYDFESSPRAFVVSPKIKPREGATFEEIPHLIFNVEHPDHSALCLFDPNGREWNHSMLIADTIVPWASEWLHHYECWHIDGVWRGRNAPGPISVAEMKKLRESAQKAVVTR